MPNVNVTALPRRPGYRSRNFGVPRLTNVDRPVIVRTLGPSQTLPQVWRIMLSRQVVRASQGTILRSEEFYLDGHQRVSVFSGSVSPAVKEVAVPKAALPIKTNNIADFGRMDEAIVGFLTVLDKIEGDPTEEQQELILQTYQGLLVWIENARKQIQDSEAKLDLVSAKVRSMILV